MSVYIHNMEMPDKCGHCRFANAFDCTVTGSFISTHSIRQPDCPLVPVPPHGRLIDADALMENAQYKGTHDIVNAWDIANAPTIIPADKEGEG